ncbi:hypothetical protein [Pelagibius sp.]|uniref:hypothetical protein n=1 Tax=Pelagibius sp. TaxID=1931238 RepID=UPI002627FFD3|nr:hypothetical protein [Pelagibius sp.]
MSFWSGKKETLLQSLVEITFKAVLTGVVIVFFAQFLIAMVDNQIEVASKRDALNTFRNDQLTSLTKRFSDAYLALDCTRSPRTVAKNACQSNVASFLTELDAIFLELKVHYPDAGFPELLDLKGLAEAIYAAPSQVSQDDIDGFAAAFGATLDEMAQNFR